MRRDPARLQGRFDLLVIGGGIYGAWIAYDAALRGLSTALVEADDWGAGTSSASSKLIHGGLRYLEQGAIGLVAKALRERGRLMRLGPHRVHPLRFLLPLYADAPTPRLALAAGLGLYDRLAGPRPSLPAHRAYAAGEMAGHAPFLAPGLRGGFAYGDAGEDDARFTLEIVAGALVAGAVAVNHCAAESLLRSGDTVEGARVRDRIGGAEHELRAAVTINAAGAWAGRLPGMPPSAPGLLRHTKGVHLVMPPLPIGEALLLTAPIDRRVFFLIPWYGATLLGTTDTDHAGDPSRAWVDANDIDYLLGAVAARCPGLGWQPGHIRGAFAGLRTLRMERGAPSSVSREWALEEPLPHLLLPVGGKFTSARVEAARTVDRALALLGRPATPCPTAHRPLPWCPPGDARAWLAQRAADGERLGLDADTARTAARRHGTRVDDLHRLLREQPAWARRVSPHVPICLAEVAHAADTEMALTLPDLLRRRIPLAILAAADRPAQASAASIAAARLGWDAQRTAKELAGMAWLGAGG